MFVLITGCLLISGFHVIADDISMSSDQPEYYFQVGTDARVPFTITSSFQNTVAGTLQYSLTRHQNDGGFSISQTSTQSQSFPVAPGTSHHALTLTSETETDYDLSLMLLYADKGKDYAVVLPQLSVHFVSDPKNHPVQQNTVRSTTSEATKTPASSQIDPLAEMEKQMKEMEEEQQNLMQNFLPQSMSGMSSGSLSPSQNPSQALQNNQMSASSSALQQQMMEESRQNDENKRKLADKLEKDSLIREQASELRSAGYNQTSGRITMTGPDSGEISATFQNAAGDEISVTGKAKNGTMASLNAKKSGEIPVSPLLQSNTTWNTIQEQLKNNSYIPQSGTVSRTSHETKIEQQYQSPDGRNATLSARIVNGTVQEVLFKEDNEFPLLWFIGILLLILLIVLCASVAYWYLSTRSKKNAGNAHEVPKQIQDVGEIVSKMLECAEQSYCSGAKKDGYSMLAQALRTHISHTYRKGDALTSDEIIADAASFHHPKEKDVVGVLEGCSLVEYAKEEPQDEQFFNFLSKVKEIIQDDKTR